MTHKRIRHRQSRIRRLVTIETIRSVRHKRISLLKSFHRHISKRTRPNFIPAEGKLSGSRFGGWRAPDSPGGASEDVTLSRVAGDQGTLHVVIDRKDLRIRCRRTSIDWVGRKVRTRTPGLHGQDVA